MKRITSLEKKHLLKSLNYEFRTSKAGIYNEKLSKLFSKKIKSKFAIPLSSGTSGLIVALKSLGISDKKHEVIIPAITMSATALAVMNAGGTPVFADVDEDTLNISIKSLKNKINKNTKALISVSIYGLPPDYDEILKILRKKNISLIEDNAECYLGRYKRKVAGNFGKFSVFSLQSSKHLTSGEGGILTTNSKRLFKLAKMYSNLGYNPSKTSYKYKRLSLQNPNYKRHYLEGNNYRLSELNASVAYSQTLRIKELINQRKKVGNKFQKVLNKFKNFKTQNIDSFKEHSFWGFCIILPKKINIKEFANTFKKNKGDFFYATWKLPYQEPYFKKENNFKCSVAEDVQKRVVALKTNYFNNNEINKQIKALKKTLINLENKHFK